MPTQTHTTLAQVLERLYADTTLAETRKRDLISSISRVSTYLKRPPEDIPTPVPQLRSLLARVHPVQIGITARALANVKSSLAAALRHTGHVPASGRRPRSTAWLNFLAAASHKYHVMHLSRFVAFCGMRRIEPHQVTDETVASYRAYLEVRLLCNDPDKLCTETAMTWNCIARQHPGPYTPMNHNRHTRYRCPPLTAYPQSLQDDVQAYIDRLAHKDIFADDGPVKPLKPMSLRNVRSLVRQYLSGLAEAGIDPSTFVSLRSVVTAECVKLAGQAIHARGREINVSHAIYNIIAVLLAIARHHLRLSEEEIKKIKALKARVKPVAVGMTAKNSMRLDQFNDFQNVVRLLGLPQALMGAADAKPDLKAAPLRAMYATAISILLACPMRISNLSALDLDRHLTAHGSGRALRYTIRVDASEVKNVNHVEVVLNERNSQLLHRYVTRYRHRVAPGISSTALFPQRTSGLSRIPSNFGSDLASEIYRETGLRVNAHLFRHIAAFLYLRERPGDFETVRRILKHKKLDTTMTFYAQLSNQWAHEHYDDVVLKKWGGRDHG